MYVFYDIYIYICLRSIADCCFNAQVKRPAICAVLGFGYDVPNYNKHETHRMSKENIAYRPSGDIFIKLKTHFFSETIVGEIIVNIPVGMLRTPPPKVERSICICYIRILYIHIYIYIYIHIYIYIYAYVLIYTYIPKVERSIKSQFVERSMSCKYRRNTYDINVYIYIYIYTYNT